MIPGHASTRPGSRIDEVLHGARLGQELGEEEIVALFAARGPEVSAIAQLAAEPARNGEDPALRMPVVCELLQDARHLRGFEKEADTIFRDAVSGLFRDPAVDAKRLLKEKEVLEDLENAIDRCERVADRLTNLAVKHG